MDNHDNLIYFYMFNYSLYLKIGPLLLEQFLLLYNNNNINILLFYEILNI